jgi:hypothetical protein
MALLARFARVFTMEALSGVEWAAALLGIAADRRGE